VTNSRDIIKRLKDDGWEEIGVTGSRITITDIQKSQGR
jgi:hypothetical protein